MNSILIPTDFSELAGYALDFACILAQGQPSELHVIKVIPAPAETAFDAAGEPVAGEADDLTPLLAQREQDCATLAQWQAKAAAKGVSLSGKVIFGHLIDDTLAFARELDADLIVMATHGSTGWKSFWSGSNAEQIVRKAPMPVVTLKCDRSDSRMQQIVLASDFQEPEQQGLQMLRLIQEQFGADLHLLTVRTPKVKTPEAELQQRMQDFARAHHLQPTSVNVFPADTVEQGVAAFSQAQHTDLVAIGTHGRQGLSHWLQGSISEDLVNHVYQPIMTFRIDQ